MKIKLPPFVFASLLLIACKKSGNLADGKDTLVGKWELRLAVGGLIDSLKYPPGTGTTLQFDADGSMKVTMPPNGSGQGQYTISPTSKKGDWWLETQYIFNNQQRSDKDSIRFEAGKLLLLPIASCCDIPTVFYERIH